jgi:hypothetical protein
MADIFSNLAAQSLSSRVGIQPLISPLFAPAPQILSDATLLPSHDQPAAATATAPFSIPPAIMTDGMTDDTSDIEQPSQEAASPEKRPILPDLVPPDAPKHAISTLSLHHLLHPQHLTHDPISFPQDVPVGADVSRPSPMYRPMPAPAQEITPPNAIPNAPEIPPSSIRHDNQKLPAKNSFHTKPTKPKPQTTSPVGPSAERAERVSIPSRPSPMYRPPFIAPLPIQPPSPASSPSPQLSSQSEQIVNPDDVPDQQSSSVVQPPIQPASTPARRGQLNAPSADVSAPIYPAQQPTAADRQSGRQPDVPPQPQRGADETPIKSLLDQQTHHVRRGEEGKEWLGGPLLDAVWETVWPAVSPEPSGTVQSVEARLNAPLVAIPAQNVISPMVTHPGQETPDVAANLKDAQDREIAADSQRRGRLNAPTAGLSATPQPSAQNTQRSAQVSPKQEAPVAKEEGEAPPIRITIGRVVVRATPAAQPTPVQKRVLRPAQSLSEYLKQRERGSR